MKHFLSLPVLLLAGAFATALVAAPRIPASGSDTPQTAVCAVCGVREKAGPEPVVATFVYRGKTYFFCKLACKEEFRLDPEKWIKAAEAAAATPQKPAAGSTAAEVPT